MEITSEKSALITRYLLNELSDSERQAIETRYFEDTEFFLEILSVKDELIQRYLQGALSPEETRRFETEFLAVESLRKEVEFAALTRRVLTEAPVSPAAPAIPAIEDPKPSWRERLFPGSRGGGNFFQWQLATVALVAILTLGGVSLLFRLGRPAPFNVAPSPVRYELMSNEALRDAQSPTELVVPPPGPDKPAELKLKLQGPSYSLYRGDLLRRDEGNRVVASQEALKPESDGQESFVLWKLEPAAAAAGDFRVELQGIQEKGERVPAGGYDFRVR